MAYSTDCIACILQPIFTKSKSRVPDCLHSCSKGGTSSYTFNHYQKDTNETAKYPGAGSQTVGAINYTILGLIGEAGEIANKWKKLFRDRGHLSSSGKTTTDALQRTESEFLESIESELGDTLWYCARLATELGIDFGEVATANIRKLNDRQQRGTLHGSGDNR